MPRSSLPSGYWEFVQDSLADLMRIMLVRCFDAEGHPEVFTPEHIQILEGELTKRLMQILRLPFFTMCQEEFSRCMKTRLCNDSERGHPLHKKMIGKFEYIHGQKHISEHTNQPGRASQQLLVHTYYHYLYVEFVINEKIWPSSVVIDAVDSTAARLHFGAVHK